jgi:succinate dehydrogenase/fumarate reductase flavoprotein subunit
LVDVFVADVGPRIREAEALGVRFDRDRTGHLRQLQMPGHRFPRSISSGRRLGAELVSVLGVEVARCPMVRVMKHVEAVRLAGTGDGIGGVVLRDLRSGEITVVPAGAVVLAAGGLLDLFRPRAVPAPDVTGDGFGLALLAEAELVDMEFTQFFPTALIWPPEIAPLIWVGALRYDCDAHLLDADGQRFMSRYASEEMELATRDVVTRAIATEVRDGRGSEHGGVWMTVKHVRPRQLQEDVRSTFPDGTMLGTTLATVGIDLTQHPLEVGPVAHFHMGGVRIDGQGTTSVPGLFAAGEVAGGLHGANRLEDNAVGEALVFGHRAGEAAAVHAAAAGTVVVRPPALSSVEAPDWVGLAGAQVRAFVVDALGPVRSGSSLANAVAGVAAIRHQVERQWPVELVGPPEVERLRLATLVAGAMLVSALKRRESRGSHYREDYPTEGGRQWARSGVVTDIGSSAAHTWLDRLPVGGRTGGPVD